MFKILTIIPARSGSKGVPHKNIKEFKGNEYTAFGTALHTVCENLVTKVNFDAKSLFQKEFLKNQKTLV